jgi:hypothetical protein
MHEALPHVPAGPGWRPKRSLASVATALAMVVAVGLAAAPAVCAASVRAPGWGAGETGPTAATRVATSIALLVPSDSVIGRDTTVTATLRDHSGKAVAGERVSVSLDGAQVRSGKTDAQGTALLVVPGKSLSEARDYKVVASFSGAHGLAPSSTFATLTILAAAIQIQTVPPVSNVRFSLGAETALTGPDGIAALPVPKTGLYELTADLNYDNSSTASVKAGFVRWLDDVYTCNRTIEVTGPATYSMGLRVAYRASVRYVDLNSQPVDPKLIDEAKFSADTGADDVFLNSEIGTDDVWWTAAYAVRYGTALTVSSVTYRAQSVKIHGAEVVNRAQQAWMPVENGVWTIQLLLYSMTVRTSDAIFGSPVAGRLTLTFPDGSTIETRVESDGRVTFANLPRGQYKLALSSVAVSPPMPVALSKDQEASLRVVTYFDVALVSGLILVIGIAILGRWVVLSRRLKQRASPPSDTAS